MVPRHVCVCFCEISEIKTREKHANLLLSGAGGVEQTAVIMITQLVNNCEKCAINVNRKGAEGNLGAAV